MSMCMYVVIICGTYSFSRRWSTGQERRFALPLARTGVDDDNDHDDGDGDDGDVDGGSIAHINTWDNQNNRIASV